MRYDIYIYIYICVSLGAKELKTLPICRNREGYVMGERVAMLLQSWSLCSLHLKQHSIAPDKQYINQSTRTTYINID